MPRPPATRLLSVQLAVETDFLIARQRAKQIANILGFENQDQTRIATAVSEIARNAFEYGNGGTVEFHFDREQRSIFRIVVKDQGTGIRNLQEILEGTYTSPTGMGLGIVGARRLMDDLRIESSSSGTTVTLSRSLPRTGIAPSMKSLTDAIASVASDTLGTAVHTQNHEVIRLLGELREREEELSQLNQELKETNRGVMVLYSELDDRALELQQASEMKTRFISSVTHELRTPLNSIVSLAGLLIRRIDGELSAEQEKQVLFIQRSAQNLTEMVNDLLDLAKIEAGKVNVKFSEFTVAELFSALRGMFRPLAMNDQIQLIIDEEELQTTRLFTDESKLAQILRNFISNALKFTARGSVSVRARLGGRDTIQFSVTDTGVGIADENRELVWQEWGQIEADQRSRHKGSGLGLPLARQLAALLDGRTWLESKLGVGSTFYVEIPISKNEPARAESSSSEDMILMVDDDEVARYLLRRTLISLTAARLVEAASVVEARRIIAANRPRLVLLDIVMPEENGLDFAQELKTSAATADLPVVVVSSKVLTQDERSLLDRYELLSLNKEQGDAEDQRAALERVLLNLGLNNLHDTERSS